MRTLIQLAALALVAGGFVQAGDPPADRERQAKAALALAAAGDPDKCECVKAKLLPWKDAAAKSFRDRTPVVVFAGDAEPRCCAAAIPVRMTLAEANLSEPSKPIVVYVPSADGTALVVFEKLPADASPARLKAALVKAKKAIEK